MREDPKHTDQYTERASARVSLRPFVIALAITTVFLVVEIVGGLLANSLALLADAGHMATDAAALGLSIFAIWLAARPATPQRSFGFYRAEVLAALVNSATLIAISFYIFWEAFKRLSDPPAVKSGLMLVVAVAGLLANGVSALVMMRSGGHEENLNMRGAFLHIVGDLLGSVGTILAAIIMLATGWYFADPLLSAGIGLLILWNSWSLLRESVDVLLEATPKNIDIAEVRKALSNVDDIEGVHDLHVWTVTSGLIAMSGHVVVSGQRTWRDVRVQLTASLRDRFGIMHVTLQPEEPFEQDDSFDGCSFDTPEGLAACQIKLPTKNDIRKN
jgi:cobalt-zinc-cadmium efflux system protein